MATEIERKWVVDDGVPPGVLDAAGVTASRLRQGYVALDGDVAVRVRVADEATARLTVKAGSGLARTEVEVPIGLVDAGQLLGHAGGRMIDKTRYAVPLPDRLIAEVDVYAGTLAGLVTVEVEFTSADDADAFVAPAWFGRDVTDDPAWSNAALALHGRPDP